MPGIQPPKLIQELSKQVNHAKIFYARLAEAYDGIGQYVLVDLSKGSVAAVYKARVASGDFNSGRIFPVGTPVSVHISRGQLEILSLGGARASTAGTGIELCDSAGEFFSFIETSADWKIFNTKGVSPPAGWNNVGFDDSAWTYPYDAEYYGVLHMYAETGLPKIKSDEILLRKEFMIADADLDGAAVVLKYALDNSGYVYVNGVQIASLLPLFDDTTSHYASDHATTLARSTFQAGLNCIAIYVANDAAGTNGTTPPGPTTGAIYIEMPVNRSGEVGTGTTGVASTAARCDHGHIHNNLLERDTVEAHPAAAIIFTPNGSISADNVQDAIQEVRDEAGAGTLAGRVLMVPVYAPPGTVSAADPGADVGYVWPVMIAGPMLLQSLGIHVSVAGSGTHEWGLFDFSSSITAATKLAGGSSTLGSTGFVQIAASGAPVTIQPGAYALILKSPNTNRATLRRSLWTGTVPTPTMKFKTGYTWDDTPDLSSGWTTDSFVVHVALVGRLDASTTW